MNKAILVIDEMPKDCGDCILCQLDGVYVCRRTRQILDRNVYEKTINRYCPLKYLPQKKDFFEEYMKVDRNMREQEFDKVQEELRNQIIGYNYCLDEILGEQE